ncbi:LysR family transcriptional regulator [Actinomadura rupiterrae]|uniref:LysR family transcriptional regulator n=1 Tax=Actinomadura rupiterrae TaxID=559627 RepID=UPI0020A5F155|nr:LysR family transcriptional regulator [Actinomadura rupiterrae]MCP2339248.1 DNA-binding transcriptional LysR family regulator [Actinomadura rupiterrae]
MELRDIEIFLALAEELHFGRTAERLHVTPSRVSQAIKKAERRVGGPLFERTSRTVRLTPAGGRLYQTLQPAYRQIIDGIEEAAAAHEVPGALTLGSMGPEGWQIREIVDRFRARHPAVRLVHRELNAVDPLTPLRSGEIDVAHLWLPVREPDITVGPITHTSPIVVVMATGHPYADRESLSLEDYGDLTFMAHRSPIPASMEEAFQPFRTPSGRLIARGPAVSDWEDQLKAVSAGQAVAAATAEAAGFYPRPDLVYIPVRDAPPIRWAFAWHTPNPNPLVRALAGAVDTHDDNA